MEWVSSFRDLGMIFSNNLSWSNHYKTIVSNAMKSLHLLCRPGLTTRLLFLMQWNLFIHYIVYYLSAIRQAPDCTCTPLLLGQTYLTACSPLWHSHLIKDITYLEHVQHRSTKFILNDFHSSYKERLMKLKLFALSLWYEYLDVVFLITSLKNPQPHFNIFKFVQFVCSFTRSTTHVKLNCLFPLSSNSQSNFIYFNIVEKLWNALSVIDICDRIWEKGLLGQNVVIEI